MDYRGSYRELTGKGEVEGDMGDSRDTHTGGAAGDSVGGGVARVMELGGQQGHPHSGSSRGLRGGG